MIKRETYEVILLDTLYFALYTSLSTIVAALGLAYEQAFFGSGVMSGTYCQKCGLEIPSASLLPEDQELCPSCESRASNVSDADAVLTSAAAEIQASPAAVAVASQLRASAEASDYQLAPPETPERPRPASSPFRRKAQAKDEEAPSFLCFPLLAVVGLTLAGMMCLCPLSMFLEFPKGLLMLWGIGLIFGGIIWFGFRFKKHTGQHMQDEAPWYLRGGLALMMQLVGYVIQEPVIFGPPFCVFVMGGLLCLSPIFIPDMRHHFQRNPAAMIPPAAPAAAPAGNAAEAADNSVMSEPSAAAPVLAQKTPTLKELLAADPMVYLTDLAEFDAQAGACPLGKNGELGNGSRIVVQGKESKHGLGMHPAPPPNVAKASFRLGKQRAILRGGAALNDTAESPWGAAVFTIRADGKVLWTSPPLKSRGQAKEFELDVEGVDVIELSVVAQTHNHFVHAVWVEPRLTKK